jgi:hypothetical protein
VTVSVKVSIRRHGRSAVLLRADSSMIPQRLFAGADSLPRRVSRHCENEGQLVLRIILATIAPAMAGS